MVWRRADGNGGVGVLMDGVLGAGTTVGWLQSAARGRLDADVVVVVVDARVRRCGPSSASTSQVAASPTRRRTHVLIVAIWSLAAASRHQEELVQTNAQGYAADEWNVVVHRQG